jgi:hypothetical protein
LLNAAEFSNRNSEFSIDLFFVDRPNLPLPVVAAMRADAVGRLRLVALRTKVGGGRDERVVSTPF